jgi:hypothetical protein
MSILPLNSVTLHQSQPSCRQQRGHHSLQVNPMSNLLPHIDEALTHLSQTPLDSRGSQWSIYLDRVLDQRTQAQQELGESCPEQSKCVVNQAVLNWSQDQAAAPTTPARLGLVTPASTTEAGTLHEGQ